MEWPKTARLLTGVSGPSNNLMNRHNSVAIGSTPLLLGAALLFGYFFYKFLL